MKISAHPTRIYCLALLFAALLAGCRDPKPVAYQVPKEADQGVPAMPANANAPAATPAGPAAPAAPAAPANGGTMAGQGLATASGSSLRWTAPTHWQTKAVSSMRKGSYTVPGENGAVGDLAITAFPGDVGGEVANVNRWRGQLQLPPLPETEIPAAITRLENHGLAMAVVDFANTATPTPQRILGAMVPFDGATWFFKLTGPDPLVAKEKAAFIDFLKTVQPTAPAP